MTGVRPGPLGLIAGLVVLAVAAAVQVEDASPRPADALESQPERVMSTSCRLMAVPPAATDDAVTPSPAHALQAAEARLREVESQMSGFIEASPLSRFNRAEAGALTPLPASLLEVLAASRALHESTDGTFDVTCGPLLDLWRAAARRGALPEPQAIDAARAASSWDGIRLTPDGALKLREGVRIDLGGVAKGFGIDRALAAIQEAGMAGGLVDVGGDLRVFGRPPRGPKWEVQVQDPAGPGTIATLSLASGAVCTSGSYQRHVQIQGRSYSHIIDPRTGRPAEGVASATVIAPDAQTADGWATALSVLGRAGLPRLPAGVEALLLIGPAESPQAVATPGLTAYLQAGPPYPLEVQQRPD